MNEEVANRVVSFAITTTRLTGRVLHDAMKSMEAMIRANSRAVGRTKDVTPKGRQSVKQLVGQGRGVEADSIADDGVRLFNRIAKKYGVDFAIMKDKTQKPAVYTVLVKSPDKETLNQIMKEYTARYMKVNEKGQTKESIREKLDKFKAIVAAIPRKVKDKVMEHTR